MRIGIDARCLMEGSRTGVEEYTIETIKRLLEDDKKNKYILFLNSFKKIKGDLAWLEGYENVEIKNYGFPNKILNLSMWLLHWPRIDVMLGGVDVFFAPNISFIALSSECRFVLTIHDLSFERFPEFFSAKRRLWHFLLNPRALCNRADKVLAVSESTKFDLRSVYGLHEEKIDVFSSPANLDRFFVGRPKGGVQDRIKKEYKLPDKFILFLGTIEPRKNIAAVIKSFEVAKKRGKIDEDLRLVIAGCLGWSYGDVLDLIKQSEFSDQIILTGFVRDRDKPLLYGLCRIFVYPSFFEGYGFPPVEAMAAGVPVITSNCSSIPEIVGDAAILIDPYRPFDITLALEVLNSDEQVYNEYVQRGFLRAKELLEKSKKQDIVNKILS